MDLPLFTELKRRRVVRALIGYGIAAFAILQVIEPVMHGLHWPDAVLSYLVVALAIGFPIVVTLAWIFDVNAGHIERTPAGPLRGARAALILAAIGILAAAPGVVWYFVLRPKPTVDAARPASIAVLPFANLSGEKENEYFSDGVTEEIINALANVDGVRVVARTSAFSYKGKNVNVRQIGEELNVASVLEGSVRREGNALRVVAQLINVADGYHLWSKTYDRELKGVFSLEDELARNIVQALKPKLLPATALVPQSTTSSEAHDLYLRGRFLWNQRTKESLAKASELFQRAIAIDPSYALAYSGLADTLVLSVDYASAHAAEADRKARTMALKALELDPSLAEVHASMGGLSMKSFDWPGAEREFRRAIELRPGYATAHHWYALLFRTLGRTTEEQVEIERARDLDPTSVVIRGAIAGMYFCRRDFNRAAVEAREAIEIDPRFPVPSIELSWAYTHMGRYDEALAALDKPGVELPSARAYVLAVKGDLPTAKAALVRAEAAFDQNPIYAGLISAAHAALGDHDQAFLWLNRALDARSPIMFGVKMCPLWDALRSDRRYHAVLKRMNLE